MSQFKNARNLIGKLVTASIAPLLVGFAFYEPIKTVTHEVILRISGVTTSGLILTTDEEADLTDYGKTIWFHSSTYSFKTNAGEEIIGYSSGTGRLRPELVNLNEPMPILVEYLPSNPSVSRMRSNEQNSLAGLIGRSLLAFGFFCGWLWFIYSAIVEYRRSSKQRDLAT